MTISFIDVVKDGDQQQALAMLAQDPSLAQLESQESGALHGATALHWAAHRELLLVLKALLEGRALVNADSCAWGNHATPLQWAADAGKHAACDCRP